MPESDERRLDETISSALIHHPPITPAQRQRAWARLYAAAVEQPMLPPDEPPFSDSPCPEMGKAARAGGILHPVWDVLRLSLRMALIMGISLALTVFAALTSDDERYRRAERTRLSYDMGSDGIYFYNVQLRFAYSMFRN
jgi:hypothetical protein